MGWYALARSYIVMQAGRSACWRGLPRSTATAQSRYGAAQAIRAVAPRDALGIPKINWCGLSMGGMVGQWLGANAPDRVEKLVLSNTNFHYADKGPGNHRLKFC